MRLLKRILRVVFVIFLLLNVMLAFHSWKFTHFYNDESLRQPHTKSGFSVVGSILFGDRLPKRLNDSAPSLPHQTFRIPTTDHLTLEGWYIASPKAIAGKPAILMFHGHGSCRSGILPEANWFLEQGHAVYMIDFRAHGNSDGEQCLVGAKESADVKALYDFARQRGDSNLVLFGVSMGASTILKAMHDFALQPAKIILEMPFGTMQEAAAGKLRMMHLPTILSGPLVFWGGTLNGAWALGYKPWQYAPDVHCPVLLQWGRNDPRVTQAETDKIMANLPPDKKLVVYENSGHQSLYRNETEKWTGEVKAFLQAQ